jgi:2-keto-4-pentenoate hydratase/2-oxohepta-3-ene-1,7-dioic acid hydratase in catechol pathway
MSARLVSFIHAGKPGYGAHLGNAVIDLSTRCADRWPDLATVVRDGALPRLAEIAAQFSPDIPEADISYCIPVTKPGRIFCVGVNYPDRNAEYKDGQEAPQHPSLFVRFPQSFVGHNRPLVRPKVSPQLDYEGEIALIIGKGGRHIRESEALSHIAALTLCNEGTVRDWVRHGKFNVTQGKNFDQSGAMGQWLVPFENETQIADIRLVTRVNGETRQDDRTSRMIFSFRKLIAYISTFTNLAPADIIVTGTPTGAGARLSPPQWLKPGDAVEIEAEGLGILRNSVVDES